MEVTNRGKMWGINGDEGTSGLSGDARLAEVFSIEANAKLVAAAPDLLAALEGALPILRQAHDRGFAIKEVEPVYNQAEAAIKQAEAK